MERFRNLSNSNFFHRLQQQLPDGISLADVINELFANISADLPSLSDDILQQISNDNYCDRFTMAFGGLGATYDVHLRLTGKCVVNFLVALIEL